LASVFILDVAVAYVAAADMLLLGCFMLLVGDEAEGEDCNPLFPVLQTVQTEWNPMFIHGTQFLCEIPSKRQIRPFQSVLNGLRKVMHHSNGI